MSIRFLRLQILSALFFSIVLALAPPLWAQKDAGAIVGTVRDPSGAVVGGAKVTARDVDRGQNFGATTSESGEYVISPLRVGRWVVTVEHAGFKKAVSSPVEINVQDRVAVNITLQVGQINEEVVVTGAVPLLQTETSELGQVVDSKQVANLPLNGRNFAQLALLSAGTAPSEPGARDEGGFGFSANGARSLQNNFLLDGIDNNSNLPDLLNETNFVIQPPVDALQEFKVESNAYSAEFGRGNGAIINAVIKSGTNQLHGSLWEFLRNDELDGRNYFDDATKPTPPYKQNQFGGTFGGPIVIPNFYDGRNRSFFFVDYEGLHIRQAQTQTALVPSLNERMGDFTEILTNQPVFNGDGTTPVLDCSGNPTFAGEIFDTRLTGPSTTNDTGFCGVPFTVNGTLNMIPAIPNHKGGGFLDPLALKLAALYPPPGPIQPNTGNNFLSNPVLNETRNNFDIRVDQKFNEYDFAFFRFSYEDQPRSIPGVFPGVADGGGFFSGDEENSYRSFATSWTHIFRPQLINEFRLGYNRINSQRLQLNANTDVSGQIGFPGVPFGPGLGGLPQLTFNEDGSAPQLGSPTFLPSKELQNSYTLSDNLTWVKGVHSLKFGTEIRREEFTIFQPDAARGTLDFSSTLTDNPGAPNAGTGGLGFASFMAGLANGGSINNLHNVDYFRQTYSFYTQDDWKVSGRLTLNVGLRYELFLPVTDRHNQVASFDLTNPSNPTLIVPKGLNVQLTHTVGEAVHVSATGSKSLINTDWNNFAPRIGMAFQINPKAVWRAGYGIFYGGQENGPYSNPSPGFNPPFFTNESFVSPCSAPDANPAGSDCTIPGLRFLANGFPASALKDPNTPIFFSVDRNLPTPYMQQWHMSVQQELPSESVLEITYAGSKGTKLYTFFNGNQAAPSANSNDPTAPRRPVHQCDNSGNCNPVFDTSIDWFRATGKSIYHSFQAHYEKRLTRGLQFQASYTWAHSIDIASNANLGPTQNNSDFRDFRYPEAEKGNSDFDVRHRFVAGLLYELPIGHGKSLFGDAQGVWNQIVDGWQVASIVTISTGNWYTVLDGNGDFANADGGAGGVSQRPDQVGDPRAHPCLPGTFFNTCAFADPNPGSFGNVGRNTIQGPGNRVWDFSLFKFFKLTERSNLEFRAEFFNVLNHTNFLFAKPGPQNGNPATVLGDPHFGFLTASRDPRQIQLAVKFSF
jgi:Carboxypeptidase regulatory-like domain/TonB dependent receptor